MRMLLTTLTLVAGLLLGAPSDLRATANPAGEDTHLCLQCHTGLPLVKSHSGPTGVQRPCLACHSPHSFTGATVGAPMENRCTACHSSYDAKSLTTKREQGYTVHPPALRQECSLCHLSHDLGAPARYWGGDRNAACARCHQQAVRDVGLTYQHTPFGNRECTSCHDPHASLQPRLAKQPIPPLCFSCHSDEATAQSLPIQHKPFFEGKCDECHRTHGARYPQNLRLPVIELCKSCHQFPPSERHPVVVGERSCTQCHSPHAAERGKLLRHPENWRSVHPDAVARSGPGACFLCHRDISGCAACHEREGVGSSGGGRR